MEGGEWKIPQIFGADQRGLPASKLHGFLQLRKGREYKNRLGERAFVFLSFREGNNRKHREERLSSDGNFGDDQDGTPESVF